MQYMQYAQIMQYVCMLNIAQNMQYVCMQNAIFAKSQVEACNFYAHTCAG